MRSESEKPLKNGGWLHKDPAGQPYRPAPRPEPPAPPVDCVRMLAGWTTPAGAIVGHAEELGVDPLALVHLGAKWAPEFEAWAFPMFDGAGAVVGIRLRRPAGDKFAVKGGRAGLFLAPSLPAQPILFVCEGPTDTAAALTLGLYAAGRPSCLGCHAEVIQTAKRTRCRQVVIVADADEPGQRGAEKLQAALPVQSIIYTPPCKDLRAAVAAGLDAADIARAISQMRWTVPK